MFLLLVWVAYGATANLGFISDDYVYIVKAREYAWPGDWPSLFRDPLYRCRATTIWITGALEWAVGVRAIPFNLASLVIHLLNVWLIYRLGRWRTFGWPVALVAAAYFAVAERPHEAVMWYSALPDLLALTFSLTALHGLLDWLSGDRWGAIRLSASFLFGLLSKESAVAIVAFLALVLFLDDRARRRHWLVLALLTLLNVAYAALIFGTKDQHLHLQDGTFVFGWHALFVLLNSAARLLWGWGVAALLLLAIWRLATRQTLRPVAFGLLWILPALAPYSFLSYMNSVPSRHTYLANLGVALVVGVAGHAAWRRWGQRHTWAVVALAAAMILHNASYIWLVKRPAFEMRSAYTERLIQRARQNPAQPLPISNRDFPFSPELARDTILVRTGQFREVVFVK
ncbi:MAG: hypothetical protein K2X03_05590 [Bryobacteraceae bacterium]|nr:hypothetical protein [Bryobacteraceae bacterium]